MNKTLDDSKIDIFNDIVKITVNGYTGAIKMWQFMVFAGSPLIPISAKKYADKKDDKEKKHYNI